MNIFIAKKDGKEIVVILKDDMVIEKYERGIDAKDQFLRRRMDLRMSGHQIEHIPSTAKEVEKVKTVRVLGYEVIRDNNEEEIKKDEKRA